MMQNDPLIGRQLANFTVERLLGRGGMAQVYYGTDVKLQRPVAIKVIDARYRDNPSYAQRFVREARAVAKWRHENIIQIYYADDEDGLYYYVMEYVDGQDLASIIASYAEDDELMPVSDVLRIARAIASALDYAHQHGVIHRDVKPSNVLVAKDGRVVLGDFGLALDVERGSMGEVFGTPHYIAPEQARRSTDAVPQSDLYALGVILYEMLTGMVPFDDVSPTSVALQHFTDPPPPPRTINPQISPEVELVLLKALDKLPRARYQTGAELIDALEKALVNEQTTRRRQRVIPLPPVPASVTVTPPGAMPARVEPVVAPVGDAVAASPASKRRGGWAAIALLSLVLVAVALIAFASEWPVVAILTGTQTPTPSATLPTATHTLTSTATASLTPSSTPTLTPAPSRTATLTPVQAVVEAATQTPFPSSTPSPSETPTQPVDTPTASPTILYPNGKKLVIYYDENGLYLFNASDANRSISPIEFERLSLDDQPLDRFDITIWSDFYPTLHPNRCMRVELRGNALTYLNPPECSNRYLVSRLLDRADEMVFWTQKEGSQQFRVLWLGEEVGRCEIGAGTCEVFVP